MLGPKLSQTHCMSLQTAQEGLELARGCRGQPASRSKACTAPASQLCPFSHHCPDLIRKGGEFNVIITRVVKLKAKSRAGQRNQRGVSTLPFAHENLGSRASKTIPPSIGVETPITAPVHAPLKRTLHTNHSYRRFPTPGGN